MKRKNQLIQIDNQKNPNGLEKLVAKLKKDGKKFRIRGRINDITRAREIYYSLKRISGLKTHELDKTTLWVYNDFKPCDEPILNKFGIYIGRWDVYFKA